MKVGDKIQVGRVEYIVREMKDGQNGVVKTDYGSLCLKKVDFVNGEHLTGNDNNNRIWI